jgi:lipopolysaccharide transport system ATP-binding protein
MTELIIQLSHVGKDYPLTSSAKGRLQTVWRLLSGHGNAAYYRALQDINFEIRRGESLGLIGENGAGKSTLLKIIAGVVKQSAGTSIVNGRIGALLELGSGFHPEYTGRENIFLAAALMGLTRGQITEKLDSIIDFADIGEHIDQPIKHYSSGMVVRLGFAVATAMHPDILITDEVLAVGDESFQKKCIRWIESYLSRGGTLLLCSHSMFHIKTLCQKAAWIHEGKLHMYGSSFDVTREYLTYHEEKSAKEEVHALEQERNHSSAIYCLKKFWIESPDGEALDTVAMGSDLCIRGLLYSPDGRPPVILFGIVRADGTPVYGSHSNEDGYLPTRLGANLFGFNLRLRNIQLLPGKYNIRGHAMDPEGLRLFDLIEVSVRVTGATRDYGLCRLDHAWQVGTLPAMSNIDEFTQPQPEAAC